MSRTTTAKKHSQTIRPNQNPRMPGKRRRPPLDASSVSVVPETNLEQTSQFIPTYSQFLINIPTFEATTVSFNADYRERPSFVSPVAHPGSSNVHSGFFPSDHLREAIVEGGWTRDVFSSDGHARIGEANDDDVSDNAVIIGGVCKSDDDLATPRVQSISTAFASSLSDEHNASNHSDIPFNSTPPLGPWLRSQRRLPTSEYHSLKATSTRSPVIPQPIRANTLISLPDDETEVSLLKEILDLLSVALEDVKFMSTFFLAKSRDHEQEVSQHIDLCANMEESLASLRRSINYRTEIGSEEWNVRSSSWYQKYAKRLLSLRTTLGRLTQLKQLVEIHALRAKHKGPILMKLEQHEAKLSDLASKFSTAFDRLRLRHLHFLLTQSHEEAKRQKELKKSKLLSRTSFERRWREGKTLRQTLRVNFNEFRQEYYHHVQRNQRHPTSP